MLTHLPGRYRLGLALPNDLQQDLYIQHDCITVPRSKTKVRYHQVTCMWLCDQTMVVWLLTVRLWDPCPDAGTAFSNTWDHLGCLLPTQIPGPQQNLIQQILWIEFQKLHSISHKKGFTQWQYTTSHLSSELGQVTASPWTPVPSLVRVNAGGIVFSSETVIVVYWLTLKPWDGSLPTSPGDQPSLSLLIFKYRCCWEMLKCHWMNIIWSTNGQFPWKLDLPTVSVWITALASSDIFLASDFLALLETRGSWVIWVFLTQSKHMDISWRIKSGILYCSLTSADPFLVCTVFDFNFFPLWRKESKNKGHWPNKSVHLVERLLNKRTWRTSHGREGNCTRHPGKWTRKSLLVFQTETRL